ncbi:MAG: FtsX-like permease family protein [Cyclobacteriaceae bacterium]|nr:FtsX-like permease family protein [Cyclobacteriaceae bacterium]
MLKNYFKVIFRSLARNKTFTIINLSGLSIGLACFILIGLYVTDEFSFDRHHDKVDRIYQLTTTANFNGEISKWNGVANKIAPTLLKEVPEVEKAVRILPNNFTGKAYVGSESIKSSENHLVWTDASIFGIFDMPFIHGDPSTALERPHTVVLTEASAIKYFGTLDVIGKDLKIDRDTSMFEVTGVIKNHPGNSRFQYPVIASMAGHWGNTNESWGNASFETYVLLHENADPSALDKKIEEALVRNIQKDSRWYTLDVHPLKNVHLQYADVVENSGGLKGNLSQLNILIGLGLIIILIAAANYMNLSTAQSQRRFKEIGITKSLGATSQQLARKFYLETSLFVLLAILIGVLFVGLSLPLFNSITGKTFTSAFLVSPLFWTAMLMIAILLTVLAGFYPAMYLSSFSPKDVLKGKVSGLGGNSSLRKGLVVAQFSVSIILIISTLILYQQLQFIKSKELGFQPEQVIAIGTTGAESRQQINSFRTIVDGLAGVSSTARSQSYPGGKGSGRSLATPDGSGGSKPLVTVRATAGITDALGIKLIAGKSLPEKSPEDTTIQIVLNRTAVEFLGFTPEEAINRRIEVQGFETRAEIVGVTEDFHFKSLREPIGAYAFHNAQTEGYELLLVKIQSANMSETISQIETEFKKIIPSAFEFVFLDQQLQALYNNEQQLGKIILIFAGLAIFIACLGLYALAAYTTEQRTKEIGIRKVMGASVVQLSAMLSKDFLKLVIISFVIAAPVAYFAMSKWLQGFAYQVDISIMIFILAGIASIFIAWFTVGFESFKAATSNPIKSLRSE